MRRIALRLLLPALAVAGVHTQAAPAPASHARPRPLDRYVAAPDAHFSRKVVANVAYTSSPLSPEQPNTCVARVIAPSTGWTAACVAPAFASGISTPLKLTTAVRVLPDTLPFPAPAPRRAVTTAAPTR